MPCYKICQSVVQVKKFAPHLHHTIKSFAIIRNFIDKYNILIIFAICLQIVKYQRIYKRLKSATFKYCPGHTEIKSQLINNRLRFFICHCAATASPSPMAGKRISACDRNKRIRQICRGRGGVHAVARDRFQTRTHTCRPLFSSRPPDTRTIRKSENVLSFEPRIFRCEIHKTRKIPANRKIPGRQKPGKRYFPAVRRP